MQQEKPKFITAIICLCIGLTIGFLMGGEKQPKPDNTNNQSTNQAQNSTPTPVMAVEAITPTQTTINQSIPANGTIHGKEIATVSPRVSGMAIERVLVEVGDWVNQGQVLAILDNQSLNQDTNALQAELRQAQAILDKAKSDLARIEPLIAIDAISREQYDSYKTAKIQAAASVDAIKARLANLAISQARTQVLAPVSGVISEKLAEVGMITTGGKLFAIIKGGTLEWQANIKADNAHQIAIGQAVEINAGDNIATAQVTRISPVVNASRELTVYAHLLDAQNLKSGMYQSGKILLGSHQALVLPQSAIMTQDGYNYVWQLKKTNQADIYQVQKHKVSLGDYQQDKVVVDLTQEMSVVAQGGNFLNDGDMVKVIDSTTVPTKEGL